RRLFSGVRILSDGRMHVSFDGPTDGPERPPFERQAAARICTLFPDLVPVQWESSWSGWSAMTPDLFPRVNQLAPGGFAALGYSGRGTSAARLIGRELAERTCGTSDKGPRIPALASTADCWPSLCTTRHSHSGRSLSGS